jgi:tetratricopeptide (TPR) repeat protein
MPTMPTNPVTRSVPFLLTAIFAVGATNTARADRITTIDGDILDHLKIVDLQRDAILYKTPDDTFKQMPINRVKRIAVDSNPDLRDLNQAEQLLKSEQFSNAITYYERAERLADTHWLAIVRARLLQCLDAADRIDLFADRFNSLLHSPETRPLAASLLPDHAPATDRGIQSALKTIERRRDLARDPDELLLLQLLFFHIADRSDRPDAVELANLLLSATIPPALASEGSYRIRARAYRRLFESSRPSTLLTDINRDLQFAPENVLPDLLLLKSDLLLQSTPDARPDERALLEAALIAMRVAIHYPDAPQTPNALRTVASIHEKMNRPATALRLLTEARDHPKTPEPLKEEITRDIDRLNNQG